LSDKSESSFYIIIESLIAKTSLAIKIHVLSTQ